MDGGRFRPALLSAPQGRTLRRAQGALLGSAKGAASAEGAQATTATTHWRYPLRLTREDGKAIRAVARAVDEAGNVSPDTAAMMIILDNMGPKLTAEQSGEQLRGTIRDGSGVAALEISLDGGARYLPVPRSGEGWSFNLVGWPGAVQPVALLHATDIHGNSTQMLVPVTPPAGSTHQVFLPLIQRSR